jgi:hypothetical protein
MRSITALRDHLFAANVEPYFRWSGRLLRLQMV